MINWHVIQTKYGEEQTVSDACARLLLDYYCPKYKITWVSRGRKHERLIPLLPRYVFVAFDTDDLYQWRSVFDISGLHEILGGESPGVVLEQEFEIMRQWAGEGGELNLGTREIFASFWEGDRVRLLDGPFVGHEVECVWTDGKIAAVEIALLGRKTKLYYPTTLCDPIDRVFIPAPGNTPHGAATRSKTRRQRRKRAASVKREANAHAVIF